MLLKLLKKRAYQTLNLIEISQKALLNNYSFFQKLHPESKVCPVLKSNAYGHGLEIIGKFVDQKIKPPFVIVDSLYEAYRLEKTKIKTPILIIGYTFPENFKILKRLKFTFPVYDQETVTVLYQYQPQAKIHLKIDTGMNRLGIPPNQAREFARWLKRFPRLRIEGIYSHLARADQPKERAFTRKQIKVFKEVIKIFEQEGFRFRWKHIAATAGAMQIFDSEFNLIRLGLGFYGLSPFDQKTKLGQKLLRSLKPALRLLSHIVQVKEIEPGQSVGYGASFVARQKTKIGILPLGYYDGLDRRLSNRGVVKVTNQWCPIVGNICMNLAIINLNNVRRARVGQKVVVYDNKNESPNSIINSAKITQTIPYDLLVKLSETTRRVLI